MDKKKVCIVGIGPAGLMAASILSERGLEVHLFDHKKTGGRKFLVAGHGGFNLSHSKPLDEFLNQYDCEEIKQTVAAFPPDDLVKFLVEIGIETYVGSTGKIFPKKGIKPIEVLQAGIASLQQKNVQFHFEHRLIDFSEKVLTFQTKTESEKQVETDFSVFALGGISWTKTGSDGSWLSLFASKSIEIIPFSPSNAGFEMAIDFPEELHGTLIKNCAVQLGNQIQFGEITCTDYGFEGAPIYALNRNFRESQETELHINFKPAFKYEKIYSVLATAKNHSEGLKQLKISAVGIWLLKNQLEKHLFLNTHELATKIQSFPLQIQSLRPIEEAISSAGGVSWKELNPDFSLKKYLTTFLAGEMLNWDAPTGGYLLQGCFSSGAWVGKAITDQSAAN